MASPCYSSPLFLSALLLLLLVFSSAAEVAPVSEEAAAAATPSHVLELGASNFTEHVSKHPFVLVEFYSPWCGHCKKLEPEYEKAAAALSTHDPPIVLAKVDATVDGNRELAGQYDVQGYPTMVILRKGGETTQEYKGPRDADGIVEYLKKQAGPASHEIKSAEDAETVIDKNKVVIAGVLSDLSGQEFDNFVAVAEKLRAEFDFVHTLEPKYLPKGEPTAKKPFIRLLKPFDELFVDSEDFQVDAVKKFIDEASTPTVTIYDKDPNSYDYVMKFFKSDNTKAMIFLNFTSSENLELFKSKYHDVAVRYKGQSISFLLGDLNNSPDLLKFFGITEEQIPLLAIQTTDAKKYIKTNLGPDQIEGFLKDFLDGKVQAHVKSEPIPEVNNEPVKVVVANSFDDVVSKSGKNVLIEFYAPWCGHCQKLAPTLDEVAVSFESDPDVIIVKMDATANDVPNGFDVKGFPTLYFTSASGELVQYEGNRTKEDLIEFIQKNRTPPVHLESVKDGSTEEGSFKDEL